MKNKNGHIRDEMYVIELCDEVLGLRAHRQHYFDFLRGDSGRQLPVDAYYPGFELVVEYHERQHSESVEFLDRKMTVSKVSRGEQRRIYDQRRRDVLPAHRIRLIEVSYREFVHDSRKRIVRDRTRDVAVVSRVLDRCLEVEGRLSRSTEGAQRLFVRRLLMPAEQRKRNE